MTTAFCTIGHRGDSFDLPENTLASVRSAWDQGADAVEVDVRLSRDGRLVVIHDGTTARVGGSRRRVAHQTLAELQALDVGRWKGTQWAGERIPTLEAVLATVPAGKRLFVEIKCGPEAVPALQRTLAIGGEAGERTTLIGFSRTTLAAARRALPRNPALLVARLDRRRAAWVRRPRALDGLIGATRELGLDGLDLGYSPRIDADLVAKVHAAGLALFVWTVNCPVDAARLRDIGVDGIATDRPGWLRSRMAA